MKAYKRGFENWSLAVKVLALTIIAVIIWSVLSGGFNRAVSSLANPLKKWIGLETEEDLARQKEEERTKREVAQQAVSLYSQFGTNLKNCLKEKSSTRPCVCPVIDFTKLSSYSLKISDSGGKKFLELLDSNLVSVSSYKTEIDEVAFVIGDLGSGFYAAAELDFYNRPKELTRTLLSANPQYLLFSQDKMVYGSNIEKLKNNMNHVSFIKLRKGITLGHNQEERLGQEIQFNVEKDYIVIEDNNFGFGNC